MKKLPASFFERPIAHRGLHNRTNSIIENSMGAIQAAIDHGFGIEIDLQPASDMTPMVFHDYLLDRLTGAQGSVSSLSVEQLKNTVLTGSNDTIPTLKSVLDLVAGAVPLLIEIKDQDMRLGHCVGPFQQHIADVLKAYHGPVAVMSFNPAAIDAFRKTAPDIPVGLVTDPFDADEWPGVPEERRRELARIPDAEKLDVSFISHLQSDLQSAAVARVKDQGRAVFCWTVRSEEVAKRALTVADNITFEGYIPI